MIRKTDTGFVQLDLETAKLLCEGLNRAFHYCSDVAMEQREAGAFEGAEGWDDEAKEYDAAWEELRKAIDG